MGFFFKVKHPEVFQGNFKKKQYFEGWYFKLVDSSAKLIYAFIIGISLDRKGGTSHSSIQFFNASEHKAFYFKFPVDQFHASEKALETRVGDSVFSTEKMILNIHQDNQSIQGEIAFSNPFPLPKRGVGYNIMGPASYVPFLPSRYGIVSLNHGLYGAIEINSVAHVFTGGKGYIDKNWGYSFPSAYIWMQCNHFPQDSVSIIASIAQVPLLGINITAFFTVLLLEGKVYRFTNYHLDSLKIFELEEMRLKIAVSNKTYELEIEGIKTPGMALASPSKGSMKSTISESLTSTLNIRLCQKSKGGNSPIYEGAGFPAGLEIQATPQTLSRSMHREAGETR